MKIIIPCCGRSSRFPNQPPKWMLPSHDGRPMIALAVSKLNCRLDQLVVTVLQEHEERFQVRSGLQAAVGGELNVVVLAERTRSQAETVARTLEALDLAEPFLVKDSDNMFEVPAVEQDYNYVCVDSLNNHDAINPRNKSYVQVDHQQLITNIREKTVISDLFSVGGYYFTAPRIFLSHYERLAGLSAEWQRELYISDVIAAMLLEKIPFRALPVKGYSDWGTIHEWKRALMARHASFVALDGFVFERGSEFFRPRFEEVKAHANVVATLRERAAQGHTIIYLSVRPERVRALTERQMAEAGLPTGPVIYGCPTAPWSLVTAPNPSLPFRTGAAIEISPDDPNLTEKLGGAMFS